MKIFMSNKLLNHFLTVDYDLFMMFNIIKIEMKKRNQRLRTLHPTQMTIKPWAKRSSAENLHKDSKIISQSETKTTTLSSTIL